MEGSTEVSGGEAPNGAPNIARSPGKTIIGPGAVFAGMTALSRAILFLLLPVFTHVLTPDEYGQLSILLAIYAVSIIVFALGTDTAIFRNIVHLEEDREASQRYVANVWTFLIVAPLVGAAIISSIAAPFVSGSKLFSATEFALTMFWAALYVGACTLPLAVLRAENRLADFVRLTLVNALLTPALIVIALLVFDAGVEGWLIASIIGAGLTLVVAFKVLPYTSPGSLDRRLLRDVLGNSLPLMPHFLSMWSLNLADRLVVASIVSVGAVGVYSLGANTALPVLVILVGINQALMVDYARAGKTAGAAARAEALRGVRRIIELQVACIAALSMFCALIMPVAINLFIDADFRQAAFLAPWFVLGYALLGLEAIPMNGITLTHGETRWVWVASVIAAAVNVAGVYLFTPTYGLEAAAIATAVGFAVLLLLVEAYAWKIKAHLEYPWRTIAFLTSIALFSYFFGSSVIASTSYLDLALRSCIAALASLTILVVVAPSAARNLFVFARSRIAAVRGGPRG